MKDAVGLITALIGLATAVVSIWQLRKEREKDTAQQIAIYNYYYGNAPPGQVNPAQGQGPQTAGSATWFPPFGGPPPGPYAAQPQAGAGHAVAGSGPPQVRKRPEVWAAVRDAGLIFAVTALLGFLIVVAGGNLDDVTIGVLNVASLLVGFTISAVRARGNRPRHLLIAGLTTWILSLLNVLLGVGPLIGWFVALPIIAISATLAGLVSLLFKRRRS
jgi:hypothetical protein